MADDGCRYDQLVESEEVAHPGQCRADDSRYSPSWTVAVTFVLFLVGFWLTARYVSSREVADRFDEVKVHFDTWAGLVGAVGGFALAAGLWFCVTLARLKGLFVTVRPRAVAGWIIAVVLVGTGIIGSLFVAAGDEAGTVDSQLAVATRLVTVIVALCLAPGLVIFLALRSLALSDDNWRECERCQLRLVLRCRAELSRALAALGSFLTLLVISTGLRRHAVIAAEPAVDVPAVGVLLYGLVFAAQLGFFYLAATSAIDRRATTIVDDVAPIPNPRPAEASTQLARRAALSSLLGNSGSWASFESAVIIAAPLVTALVSSAIGD